MERIGEKVILELSRDFSDAVNSVVKKFVLRGSQEPSITVRIASNLEQNFNGKEYFMEMPSGRERSYQVSVVAQDFTDRGRNSQESYVGADLYIAVRVHFENGTEIMKGILIQAKKLQNVKIISNKILKRELGSLNRIQDSCLKMRQAVDANSAFLWLYDDNRLFSAKSDDFLNSKDGSLPLASSEDFFYNVFGCSYGDRSKANTFVFSDDKYLAMFMNNIHKNAALLINLNEK